MKKIIITAMFFILMTNISGASVLSSVGVDLTPPPVIFLEVTSLLNQALLVNNDQDKIDLMSQMKIGLNSLPPCKIHTSNALYTVAMNGGKEVKQFAIKMIEDALASTGTNLPLPSFVMAKVVMKNYVTALKAQL